METIYWVKEIERHREILNVLSRREGERNIRKERINN